MEIIGDRNEFAVKMELLEEHHGEWLFGRFSYLLRGETIGDWDSIVSFRDVLSQMQYPVKDCGKRSDATLCKLNTHDLFFNLDDALYSGEVPAYKQVDLPEGYAKFDLRLQSEVFDGWRIFTCDCGEFSRVLVRQPQASLVEEVSIRRGAIDFALRHAYDAIDIMLDNEAEKRGGE